MRLIDISHSYNNGKWTQARFDSFIKSALRSASQRWPPKFNALADAKKGKRINLASGRLAEHYACAVCKNEFPAKEIQVDHIHPVIDPTRGFISWDEVVKRMFCEKGDFQILCRQCHSKKSTVERQTAIERKKNNKNGK